MFGLLLARDVTSPTRLVQNIEYINSAQLLFYELVVQKEYFKMLRS